MRHERYLVETLRSAEFVKVIVNEGTNEEIVFKLGGRCPHDIALVLQNHLNGQSRI